MSKKRVVFLLLERDGVQRIAKGEPFNGAQFLDDPVGVWKSAKKESSVSKSKRNVL